MMRVCVYGQEFITLKDGLGLDRIMFEKLKESETSTQHNLKCTQSRTAVAP